jgi:hypothetical protein
MGASGIGGLRPTDLGRRSGAGSGRLEDYRGRRQCRQELSLIFVDFALELSHDA